jgi:hypothetical protein
MCPPVEIPHSSATDFEDEAQVTAEITEELRRKFREATSEDSMRLVHFKSLLLRYGCCREEDCAKFFRAFDRDSDERLSFAEFARGSIAADPACPHVLNSFTGYERSRYAFDFFAEERHYGPEHAGKTGAGNMEYAEFLRLLAACTGRPRNGLQNLDLSDDTKVSQLGLTKTIDGEKRFVRLSFKLFYSLVSGEKLRGTSRLFRFNHGLLPSTKKPRGSKQERASRRSRRGGNVSAEADSDEDEATVELLLTHGVKLTPLHDDHVWIFSDR